MFADYRAMVTGRGEDAPPPPKPPRLLRATANELRAAGRLEWIIRDPWGAEDPESTGKKSGSPDTSQPLAPCTHGDERRAPPRAADCRTTGEGGRGGMLGSGPGEVGARGWPDRTRACRRVRGTACCYQGGEGAPGLLPALPRRRDARGRKSARRGRRREAGKGRGQKERRESCPGWGGPSELSGGAGEAWGGPLVRDA